MATLDTAYDAAIKYAADLGSQHGKNAASWYEIGPRGPWNGPDQDRLKARAILRGIEDGDPAVLDTFPHADLSGEWADTLTGPQLVEDAIDSTSQYGTSHIGHSAGDDACEMHDWFASICDAYEVAFSTAVEDAIASAARAILA